MQIIFRQIVINNANFFNMDIMHIESSFALCIA